MEKLLTEIKSFVTLESFKKARKVQKSSKGSKKLESFKNVKSFEKHKNIEKSRKLWKSSKSFQESQKLFLLETSHRQSFFFTSPLSFLSFFKAFAQLKFKFKLTRIPSSFVSVCFQKLFTKITVHWRKLKTKTQLFYVTQCITNLLMEFNMRGKLRCISNPAGDFRSGLKWKKKETNSPKTCKNRPRKAFNGKHKLRWEREKSFTIKKISLLMK